jgi:osmotically-inducible protein OsmY
MDPGVKRILPFLILAAVVSSCNRPEAGAQSVEAQRITESADERQQAKPLPDASLAAIVKSALVSDSSLDANKIDIENRGGNVALYGSVESPQQKEKAERIVMSVGGVKSVANHLSVKEEASSGTGGTAPVRGLPEPR